MILNIHKSKAVTTIILIIASLCATASAQAIIIVPYSPQIDILNTNSTSTNSTSTDLIIKSGDVGISTTNEISLLENSASSTIAINALKIWQENGDFNRKLKIGSKGNDVMVLQIILKSLLNDKTKWIITHNFGIKTESALESLQAKLNIPITGELDTTTRLAINDLMYNELCPMAVKKIGVDNMVENDLDKVFENLNRSTSVPLDYIPQDLTRISNPIKTIGVMCVSERIVRHLDEMIADAKKQKLDIAITSSYRSAKMQKFLYSLWVDKSGDAAKAGVAEAGHSEHQLGTTIDVSGKSIGYAGTSASFANSKEGRWMAQNSYKYGFIMSYPDKKQKETGYIYEPWHFRYIGVDNAKDIFTDKITIQDFLNFSTDTDATSSASTTSTPASLSTSTISSSTTSTSSIDINIKVPYASTSTEPYINDMGASTTARFI